MSINPIDTQNADRFRRPEYRQDIDGLRAIAVLCVVGFHAYPGLLKGGFIGVDIFFVISGFLISTIIFENLERNSFSFCEFYARRIRRIFPALILVMVASLVIGWLVLLADEYKQLGKHVAAGAGFISNFVLWNESGYFDSAADTKPLLHLWSLGIEEQFYIVWPLVLWTAWRWRWNWLLVSAVFVAGSFVLNLGQIRSDPVAAFYSPYTRFWELLTGSILGYLWLFKPGALRRSALKYDNLQSFSGALLIIAGLVLITRERLFPGAWALLPTIGTALIIAAGSQAWLNRTVLSHRVLVWFGLISFPLYLWHWPLLSFARAVEGELPARGTRNVAVIAAILLAWLTYKLVERPIRFGKNRRTNTNILLGMMIAVGLAGYSCYEHDGFGFRIPPLIQELTQFKYDYSREYRVGTCLLGPDQDYAAFDRCESKTAAGKRTILIWGDSHAAAFSLGYKAFFAEKFNILQRTASACPPLMGAEFDFQRNCKDINDHIFELVKEIRPDTVVLSAAWPDYDWEKIDRTIFLLRQIGIANIDLIGPLPQWVGGLPKQMYLYFKTDVAHRIPPRMNFGLNENVIKLEPSFSNHAKSLGVNYISPRKILCDDEGCLTRVGEGVEALTAFDYGHLTGAGSQYLVSKFPGH